MPKHINYQLQWQLIALNSIYQTFLSDFFAKHKIAEVMQDKLAKIRCKQAENLPAS